MRGGRIKDLPGIKYTLIRGKLDLQGIKKRSNSIMMNGKSHLSEKLVKDFFKGMQKKTKKDCVMVFKLALKNTLTPVSHLTIKKRKKQKSYIPFFLLKKKRIPKVIKQICSNIPKFKFEGNLFLTKILPIFDGSKYYTFIRI